MENKYYTPDISEFYVGFEYEVNEDTAENPEWIKKEYALDDFIYPEHDDYGIDTSELRDGYIRVKYLDKEDIESLGFKQLKSPIWFHVENVSLFDSGVYDLRISIWPREDNIRITISYPGVDDEQIFVGKCKNKSELKQILKMIGYDYNN